MNRYFLNLAKQASRGLFSFCLVTGLFVIQPVSADIYKYKDPTGRIYMTDRPMKKGYRLVGRIRTGSGKSSAAQSKTLKALQAEYNPMISTVAEETRIRPELIHAVVEAESAYNPKAVSPKGAVGLMQLMPATAKRYGVSNPKDPNQNLAGGAKYLRDLLEMFNFNLKLALAAYNAGENAVIKYGRQIPPYPETQNYVKKVITYFDRNRGA